MVKRHVGAPDTVGGSAHKFSFTGTTVSSASERFFDAVFQLEDQPAEPAVTTPAPTTRPLREPEPSTAEQTTQPSVLLALSQLWH